MRRDADSSAPTPRTKAERATLALARIPYAVQMGACLHDDADRNAIVLRLPFVRRLVGNVHLSSFHGGVIGSFMQIAALTTVFAELGEQRPPRFIDFSIDYLSHAGPKDLLARCDFQRVGRRVAAVSVCCWQTNESTPVAVARAHLHVGATAAADP